MLLFIVSSCIDDTYEDCGVYLEFIFDYNMEYADSFDPQVGVVDVYIFDEEGNYLLSKHADSRADLINHKQMFISGKELLPGTYQVITVGGLSEHFRFTDSYDTESLSGSSAIEQIKLELYRESNVVSHEFPHLWFGVTTLFHYQSDISVCPVYLIRNTNRFNVALQNNKATQLLQTDTPAPYTFEIITPEGGIYGRNNEPLVKEQVSYLPYYLESTYSIAAAEEPAGLVAGKLNTMRLLADNKEEYSIVVRDNTSNRELWNYNLMDLLEKTRPFSPMDGTLIPLQEYLDRQGEWNIVILYREETPGDPDGFAVVSIHVNGWIVWLNDIGI